MNGLYEITWLDIQSCDEPWIDLKEAKEMKPIEMKTLGYIIEANDDYVVVASTLCSDGETVGSVNSIPTSVIKCCMPIRKSPEDCKSETCCSGSMSL
tara:strand:+ start:1251 stop:1541 length:291 start_codon:yes stop_codon:yes gene_type:complete